MVNHAYLDLWWYWSFYSSRRLISLPWCESLFLKGTLLINPKTWWTSPFLIEKIFINARIFRNPLCARILFTLGFPSKFFIASIHNGPLHKLGLPFIGPWTWIRHAHFTRLVGLHFYPLQLPPSPLLVRHHWKGGPNGVMVKNLWVDNSRFMGWRLKWLRWTVQMTRLTVQATWLRRRWWPTTHL